MSPYPSPASVWPLMLALMTALENRHPGITEEIGDFLEGEWSRGKVARLRGPSVEREVLEATDAALVWAREASLLIDARPKRKTRA